jgi:hypothetical protein
MWYRKAAIPDEIIVIEDEGGENDPGASSSMQAEPAAKMPSGHWGAPESSDL